MWHVPLLGQLLEDKLQLSKSGDCHLTANHSNLKNFNFRDITSFCNSWKGTTNPLAFMRNPVINLIVPQGHKNRGFQGASLRLAQDRQRSDHVNERAGAALSFDNVFR